MSIFLVLSPHASDINFKILNNVDFPVHVRPNMHPISDLRTWTILIYQIAHNRPYTLNGKNELTLEIIWISSKMYTECDAFVYKIPVQCFYTLSKVLKYPATRSSIKRCYDMIDYWLGVTALGYYKKYRILMKVTRWSINFIEGT